MKPKTNIVWLKRDLRLTDHVPLFEATCRDVQFLVLYLYEPSLMNDSHTDERHWRFIQQSLLDIENGPHGQTKEMYSGMHILAMIHPNVYF